MIDSLVSFEQLCGLLRVVGAINRIHVDIAKPLDGSEDYYYFMKGG